MLLKSSSSPKRNVASRQMIVLGPTGVRNIFCFLDFDPDQLPLGAGQPLNHTAVLGQTLSEGRGQAYLCSGPGGISIHHWN